MEHDGLKVGVEGRLKDGTEKRIKVRTLRVPPKFESSPFIRVAHLPILINLNLKKNYVKEKSEVVVEDYQE